MPGSGSPIDVATQAAAQGGEQAAAPPPAEAAPDMAAAAPKMAAEGGAVGQPCHATAVTAAERAAQLRKRTKHAA